MEPWYKRNPDFFAEEQAIVRVNFPTLRYLIVDETVVLCGELPVAGLVNGIEINDSYEIRIEFPVNYPFSSHLPKVFEVGGRKERVVKGRELPDIGDLHFFVDNESACLCYKDARKRYFPPGSSIEVFLNELVVWFFCQQSYFELTGEWPNGEYGHGAKGALEFYADELKVDNLDLLMSCIILLAERKQVKGHWLCPCGSQLAFRRCHPELLIRLWELRNLVSCDDAKDSLGQIIGAIKKAKGGAAATNRQEVFANSKGAVYGEESACRYS